MYEADVLTDLDQLRSRYEVFRRLGFDGGREVYAVRSKIGERHFSVGVVSRESGGAGRGALRLWQAHTIQAVSHPGLVPIHAVHHLQGGTVAVAVERRRGRTLAERLREEGPLAPAEAEGMLREIAEVLGYLHERGIVHRDVRSASIFLDRDAKRARLSLFAIEPEPVPGKPSSATAASEGKGPGPATDLLALGLVGYEMLIGRPAGAGADLPPLGELRPDLPGSLCVAIEGCVAPPASRWRTAAELVAALDGEATPRTSRARVPAIAREIRRLAASVAEEISVAAARWPALPALTGALGATLLFTLASSPSPTPSPAPSRTAAAIQAPRGGPAPTASSAPAPNPSEGLSLGIEWEPAAEVAVVTTTTRTPANARSQREVQPPAGRAPPTRPEAVQPTLAAPASPFADGLVLLGELVDP